jgi:hypothetical protein
MESRLWNRRPGLRCVDPGIRSGSASRAPSAGPWVLWNPGPRGCSSRRFRSGSTIRARRTQNSSCPGARAGWGQLPHRQLGFRGRARLRRRSVSVRRNRRQPAPVRRSSRGSWAVLPECPGLLWPPCRRRKGARGERFLRECESSAGPTKWEQVRSMPMRLAGKLGRQDKTGPFLSGTQDSIRREATSRLTKFRYCWRWRKAGVRPQKNENRNKLT